MRNRLARALIPEEEEELILQDRSANRAAEDVLVERRRGQGDRVLLEEVAGIQEGIAVKLKHVAVEVVGALLDRGADDRSTVTVVLSIERAGEKVELLKSVDVGLKGDSVQGQVVCIRAIDDIGRLLGLRSVDREGGRETVTRSLHAGQNQL